MLGPRVQIELEPIDLDEKRGNKSSSLKSMAYHRERNLRRGMPYPTSSLADWQRALD